MTKNSRVEEIKKLIKNGFDLELISFELDMPIEEVNKYKIELEKVNKKNTYPKMEKLRERYKELFYKTNEIKLEKQILTPQEENLINSVISEFEKIEENLKGASKDKKRREVFKITKGIESIEECNLTVEQAEKLYYLLQANEIKKLKFMSRKNKDYKMNKCEKIVTKKVVDAIDVAQSQAENIEELKSLEKKLTMKMNSSNQIIIGTVKNKIKNKILKINQRKAIEKQKNIPDNINLIIKELASGTLDIEKANIYIENEVKDRRKNKPENKFAVTDEQEKRQIFGQIMKNLVDNSEKYNIENPETTIQQIQELCDCGMEQAIRIVVKNFSGRKNFEKANEICNEFLNKSGNNSMFNYMKILKKEIKNDEIGDIVLKAINLNGTYEKEKECFELIEKGLNMGNVNLRAVSLGKTQDGLKNITLADIWIDRSINHMR